MASVTSDQPRHISLSDLDEVIACAHAGQWERLALIGPNFLGYEDTLIARGWKAGQVFRLREPLHGSSSQASRR